MGSRVGVSVSLRSIVHSYLSHLQNKYKNRIRFPSLCGVSFILIFWKRIHHKRFYSRVSVSLRSIIHSYKKWVIHWNCLKKVSVSLWSIIHSYNCWKQGHKPFKSWVSVSLWNIVHSYPMVKKVFYYNMFLEYFCKITLIFKN